MNRLAAPSENDWIIAKNQSRLAALSENDWVIARKVGLAAIKQNRPLQEYLVFKLKWPGREQRHMKLVLLITPTKTNVNTAA